MKLNHACEKMSATVSRKHRRMPSGMRAGYAARLAIGLIGLAGMAAGQPVENRLALRLRHLAPAASEDWQTGTGIEAQARFWSADNVGLGLSFGYESWPARSEFIEETTASGSMALAVAGEAVLTPVGVSLLHRVVLGDRASLILEAGLRYAPVQSRIYAEAWSEEAEGMQYWRDRVEIDSVTLGVLGAELAMALSDEFSFHAGFGWQRHLAAPRERWFGADAGTTSFEAVTLFGGFSWRF